MANISGIDRPAEVEEGTTGPGLRRILLAAWIVVVVSVGLSSPRPAAAQDRCETVSGAKMHRLGASLERQASLRDSLRRILTEEDAHDSAGALLVWTDEEAMKTRMALVNLDPPPTAYYRIRGLLAGHFRGAATALHEHDLLTGGVPLGEITLVGNGGRGRLLTRDLSDRIRGGVRG